MPNQSHPLAKRLCTAMATLPSKGAPESTDDSVAGQGSAIPTTTLPPGTGLSLEGRPLTKRSPSTPSGPAANQGSVPASRTEGDDEGDGAAMECTTSPPLDHDGSGGWTTALPPGCPMGPRSNDDVTVNAFASPPLGLAAEQVSKSAAVVLPPGSMPAQDHDKGPHPRPAVGKQGSAQATTTWPSFDDVPGRPSMPPSAGPASQRSCVGSATALSIGSPLVESCGGASAALALQPAAKQVSQAEPTALEHSHTEGRPDGPPPPRTAPSSKPSPGETVTSTPSGGVLEDAGDAAQGKRLDPICHSSGPPVGGVATSPTSADGADKCNGITAAPMGHHTRRKRLPTAARAPPPKQKRGCKQPRPVVTGGRKALGLTVCPCLFLLCL